MTLPRGWAKATIADVATFNPKHPVDSDRSRVVSFVPMPAVDEELGAIVDATDRTLSEIWSSYTHFAEGDVIFAKITPCMENGKAAIAANLTNGMACGSTEFYVLRPEATEAGLLWRFLRQQSFRTEAERHMSGAVGQRRVPRRFLEEYPFPLPPLAEQRRIVAKLDALTARLARARAELDRVPVLATRLRDAAYRRAFTSENLVPLEQLTPSDAPIIYGILQPGPDLPNGVPYVRPTEIERGTIKLDELRRTSPEIARRYRRATIREGDIILTIVGTIGKVAIVPDQLDGANITQSSCRIRPDSRHVMTPYLRHWLKSPSAWRQYNARRLGTAVPRLNIRDIRAFKVPLPSLADQAHIAALLDAEEARCLRAAQEAARARSLIDRLEAAVVARAFRGELVPQDPSEEPASFLLDRIGAQRAAAPKAKRTRKAAFA